MSQHSYKLVLVGCGRISKNHLKAVEDNAERIKIAAVCDIVEDKAKEASKASGGVPYFCDIDAMLGSVEADVALIGTPSGLHPVHSIQCARAGLHVITEKPMAISLAGADSMIKVCEEMNVRLFVVKQNRLNQTVQLLRRAVDKGRFGRIYFAQVNVFWSRPQSYYDLATWRGTWEFDGGAFMNQASHYIDLVNWLVGDVDSVQAVTATLARRIEAEDTGSAVLRFKNGAIGSINVTMLAYPKNFEGSITILGERGIVKLGGPALNRVEAWEFADYDDDDKGVAQASYSLPSGPAAVYGYGHSAYFHSVLDTLDGKCDALTDGNHGRKSLELILAVYKAARENSIVHLPL